MVAQVTRTNHQLPSVVPLTKRDGLPRNCFVNCDGLLTVPKTHLTQKITTLSAAKMNAVHVALKFAMEIP